MKLRMEMMLRRECGVCAGLLLVELYKEEDRRLSCRSMIPVPRRMAWKGALLILVLQL